MKVVLVRPNYPTHIVTPPLGLACLSAYLKENGVECSVVDGLRDRLDDETLLDAIRRERPDAVGITSLSAFHREVARLSLRLAALSVPHAIGGAHPTALPMQTLRETAADFVVCGEGELPLLELARRGFRKVGPRIQGVFSRGDMSVAESPDDEPAERAEVVEDLDTLPFPDWSDVDPRSYPPAPHGAVARNFPVGVVATSRGCPFECSFCASPGISGRRIRFRSPESVVAEIRRLVDEFGVREVHFEDDNFTLRRDHAIETCRLLRDEVPGISIAFPNGVRADRFDDDVALAMKEAGCHLVAFGVESADPGILRNIRKGETIEAIAAGIATAERHGIASQGFFIFGLPGETRETMERSVRFALDSGLSRAQFLVLDVLPGSELWERFRGEFVPDWGKRSYQEPEWIPEGLTRREIMRKQTTAFLRFYGRPRTLLRLLRDVRPAQFRHLLDRLVDFRIVPVPSPRGSRPRR